jgi:acetyl-CoA acetyltransferase
MRTKPNVAIIGVGNTAYGSFPEEDSNSLAVKAFKNALLDANVQAKDIDGIVTHRVGNYQKICEMTGINPGFISIQPPNGRLCGVSIQIAALALMTGQAKTIALFYGNDGKSGGSKYGGKNDRYDTAAEQLWFPYGMTSPGAVNALMFQRHCELYGTKSEDLAEIAVAIRSHAQLNPQAVLRKPMTIQDHQSSKMICAPLRLFDYCQINDGGIAMIMTTNDRAIDYAKQPVYIRGFGQASSLADGIVSEDFNWGPMNHVAKNIYSDSDLPQSELDGLMIYDNFTPSVIFGLEGFGFCKQGEGGSFVGGGRLRLNGPLPINTSGGHLSESYMQGWNLNIEAIRQIRGECDARQIKDARHIQYIAPGPVSTSIIYSSEKHR